MTIKRLQELRKTIPCDTEREDICNLVIDSSTPIDMRAKQFLFQVKNPYAIKVNGINVNLAFNSNKQSLRETILTYLNIFRI